MSGRVDSGAPHLRNPRFTAKRLPRLIAVVVLLAIPTTLGLLVIWAVVHDGQVVWTRYSLDHHGARAIGRVTRTREDDTWQEEGEFYETVTFGNPGKSAEVKVGSDTHPVGSELQIRYDPSDPTRAISTEDPPASGVVVFFLSP